MIKKALGKGLAAFIPEEFSILKGERYAELDVDQLRPNPLQPRLRFEEEGLNELARSIRESGVVQPLLVAPAEGHYRIIVGERRWRAAQKAGLKKIPVLIRAIPPQKQLELALIENIHREDLNPLEIAGAYQRLVGEMSLTQQDIADKVGKDRASVANYLRLLKLPREIQAHLAADRISMGHARALLALEDADAQRAACRQVVDKGLSVRQTEKLAARLKERAPRAQRHLADPDLHALQEEMIKTLGTKVMIKGTRNKGVIKVFYFSLDDLNRIFDKMR
ncbi:MAG: ParB/RepB/Spo0J family partition protein [Candidatus Aminicenantes bacterium]|nr:ParB/RepB/Spo0J family partition protein [Candidatus Aminicenantes bacterium]